jgi:hypothetical protein
MSRRDEAPNCTVRSNASRKVLLARSWLGRLENLERVLAEANMGELAQRLASPDFDGVPEDVLASNRSALLREIDDAKRYFRNRAGD